MLDHWITGSLMRSNDLQQQFHAAFFRGLWAANLLPTAWIRMEQPVPAHDQQRTCLNTSEHLRQYSRGQLHSKVSSNANKKLQDTVSWRLLLWNCAVRRSCVGFKALKAIESKGHTLQKWIGNMDLNTRFHIARRPLQQQFRNTEGVKHSFGKPQPMYKLNYLQICKLWKSRKHTAYMKYDDIWCTMSWFFTVFLGLFLLTSGWHSWQTLRCISSVSTASCSQQTGHSMRFSARLVPLQRDWRQQYSVLEWGCDAVMMGGIVNGLDLERLLRLSRPLLVTRVPIQGRHRCRLKPHPN